MSYRAATLVAGAVLLALFSVAVAQLPVPYVVEGPGPTVNTVGSYDGKPVISVTGRQTSRSAGHLNLTTVSLRDRIDLLTGIRAWLDRRYAVVPREVVFPPGRSQTQVDKENAADFKTSQSSAEVAALRQLGYPLQVTVGTVLSDGAAHGKLRAGDAIVALDGTRVTSAAQLVSRLRAHHPGDLVTVSYERHFRAAKATIRTGRSKASPKQAALGIQVDQQPAPPLKISFNINDIGGPSAGLMFSLGIIDLLTPADLTGGRFVAGTGTIDDDGVVGPIGGIHQKLVAARAAGATAFLTPAGNCADARMQQPKGIRLVKVATLQQALAALTTLRSGRGALPSC